uniref:Uncharacterized protein n=1 Tax=Acrobeloides nanus TaxID=290746 RepID=A0A914CSW8_9BILA
MEPNEPVEYNTDVKKDGKKLLKKLGSTARKVKNLMICSPVEEATYKELHKEKPGEKEPKSDSVPEFPDRIVVNEWLMMDCEPLYKYLSTTYSDARVQSTEIESLI